MTTSDFAAGGYRYIPAVFQYSGGVGALPGFAIERVRFRKPVPLPSFCACELRSPAPFSDQGFRAFNEVYVVTLGKWGIYDGRSANNPVARSNVCPEIDPPAEPSFHAFSFTAAAKDAAPSFVVAGSGEAREGPGNYSERTVRAGDTSPDGLRKKGRFVLGEMERRLGLLGVTWADTTATQVYTVYDLHPFLGDEIVRRGAARGGLTWHYCRPPVRGLDYEMDCRGVANERVA
jgi:hypothetical protein